MADPVRIAVIGAGPAGFFFTAEMLKQKGLDVRVDLFDRLPTPYGLVRHGVAPDHQKIKSITQRYHKEAEAGAGRMRLFGNVEIGRDVTIDELRERYHALVFAFGAQSNRRLGIPGEELDGVHPASIFVGWYNGHPDCAEAAYDLHVERAVVVGVGNVAVDVARILSKPNDELARTDISDIALAALARNAIREVVVLGRQSAAQASFTPGELEELAEIPGADLVVAPADRRVDARTRAQLEAGTLDARVKKNLEIIEKKALAEPRPGRRAIRLRFYASPVEILGQGRIEAVRVKGNDHVVAPDGSLELVPTDERETIPCGILFRSVGYRVAPVEGVPFDEKTATTPHLKGQVLERDGGAPIRGFFVTGWAKRGPTGVIGTNKPDAAETAATLVEVHGRGELPMPALQGEAADVETLLVARGVRHVSFADWKLLDEIEVTTGKEQGRPRRKFVDVASMLEAIARAKMKLASAERMVRLEG